MASTDQLTTATYVANFQDGVSGGAEAAAEAMRKLARETESHEVVARRSSSTLEALEARLDSGVRLAQAKARADETLARQTEVLNRAVASGIRSQEDANRLITLATQRRDVYVAGIRQQITAEEERNKRLLGGAEAMRTFGSATEVVSGGASRVGSSLGQLGYQVQDFATQVSMGQNAMVAFGVQFAQFAGAFGTAGAIAGAFVTVGLIAYQLLAGKDAAAAFNAAIEAQDTIYRRTTEAAQRYRQGLQEEAQAIVNLRAIYKSYSEDRARAEEFRLLDAQRGLQQQTAALTTRVQTEVLPDGVIASLRTNAAAATQVQRGGGTVSPLATQSREALAVIFELNSLERPTTEALARLSTRMQDIAGVSSGNLSDALRDGAEKLRGFMTEAERLEKASGDNSRQLEALRSRIDGVAAALGGASGAAAVLAERMAALDRVNSANPTLGLQQQTAAIEARLSALRRGGTEGEEAERRRQEGERRVMEESDKAWRAALEQAGRENLPEAEARRRALAAAAAAEIETHRLNERTEALHRETEARKKVERERDRDQNRNRNRDTRTGERLDTRLDSLDAEIAGEEAIARAYTQSGNAMVRLAAAQRAAVEARRYGDTDTARHTEAVEKLTDRYIKLAMRQAETRNQQQLFNQRQSIETLEAEARLVGVGAEQRERELAALRERQRILSEKGGDPNSESGRERIANAERIATMNSNLNRQRAAYQEIERIAESTMERVGSAITEAFVQGNGKAINFGNIAKGVFASVAQSVIKLAVLNPILNSLFGRNLPTLTDVNGALNRSTTSTSTSGGGLGSLVESLFGRPTSTNSAASSSTQNSFFSGLTNWFERTFTPPSNSNANITREELPSLTQVVVANDNGSAVRTVSTGGGPGAGSSSSGGGFLSGIASLFTGAGRGASTTTGEGGSSSSGSMNLSWLSNLFSSSGSSGGISSGGGFFSGISNWFIGSSGAAASTSAWSSGAMGTTQYLGDFGVYDSASALNTSVGTAGAAGTLGSAGGGFMSTLGGMAGGFGIGTGIGSMVAGNSKAKQQNAMIGAGIGTVVGAFFGVPMIGGALGGALGGLFGPSKQHNAWHVTVGVDEAGQLAITDSGQKWMADTLDKALSETRTQLKTINDALADNGVRAVGGTGSFGQERGRGTTSLNEVFSGFRFTSDDPNVAKALQDRSFNTVQELGRTVDWVQDVYNRLVKPQEGPVDQYAESIKTLNKSYDDAIRKTRELNLSESDLADGRAKALKELERQRNDQAAGTAVGVVSGLLDFTKTLRFSDASPLAPRQMFDDANTDFASILKRVQSGDFTAISDLRDSAETLLQTGRGVYGSGTDYVALFDRVLSGLEAVGATSPDELTASVLKAEVKTQTEALVSELKSLKAEVAALRTETRIAAMTPARAA
jgi:hypothetical protein